MDNKKFINNYIVFTIFVIVFAVFSFKTENENSSDTLASVLNTLPPINFQFNDVMPDGINEITLPLKNAGRLFMLEATIDNVKGNLIFDSGATELVLNRTYFRDHVKTGSRNSLGITGSVNGVDRINIGKLNIGPLKYEKLTASMADLGHIENQRGVKILGLMNFELIRDFEIVIDAEQNELQIHRIDRSGDRISGSLKTPKYDYKQNFTTYNNIVFLRININGKPLKFCFDTGAEISALNIDVQKQVLSSVSIERKIDLRGSGNLKKEVFFGRLKELNLDGYKIKNMQIIVTGMDALSEAYNTTIDGILGYNFLSEGTICFNFVKKQLFIKFKNKDQE